MSFKIEVKIITESEQEFKFTAPASENTSIKDIEQLFKSIGGRVYSILRGSQ